MKVSIVLNSYNHGRFIKQSIESALNQTYSDFELIIVDDCSTDDSWDIIKSFKDKRIRAYRNESNIASTGYGMIRYTLERYVKGEYVAILHSDDFWEPSKLEKQMDFMESDKKKIYGAIFTLVNVVNESNEPYDDDKGFYYRVFEQENRSRFEWLRYFFDKGNCLCHPSVLIRTKFYKKYHLFSRGLRQTPDFYMWIQLCMYKEIYIIQEKLTNFRVLNNERNTSGFNRETSIRSSIERFLTISQYLQLKRYNDFVKVFPEIENFMYRNNFCLEFALAMVCIEKERPDFYQLYGYRLLFELLNDEKKERYIKENFAYEVSDFWEINCKYDVFSLFPVHENQICSLYYDCGEGYTEEHSIKRSYIFLGEQKYEFKFYISNKDTDFLTRLRFDPLEGVFIKCRIIKACWGENQLQLKAENGIRSGEWDYFYTIDPIYQIEVPKRNKESSLFFIAEISRIEDWELENYLKETIRR